MQPPRTPSSPPYDGIDHHPLLLIGEVRQEVRDLRLSRDQHHDRLTVLEQKLADNLRSWLEPLKPHAWKVVLGCMLILASRLKTGEWPDPVGIIEKLLK